MKNKIRLLILRVQRVIVSTEENYLDSSSLSTVFQHKIRSEIQGLIYLTFKALQRLPGPLEVQVCLTQLLKTKFSSFSDQFSQNSQFC